MTKKDLVGEAVRVYLELRKAEMREAMLAKLRKMDGSVASSVSLLTGISPEDIDRLGGINEEELADGVRSAHPEDANGRPPAPAPAHRRTSRGNRPPALAKARTRFSVPDAAHERIRAIDDEVIWKVKVQRWRGAVWTADQIA